VVKAPPVHGDAVDSELVGDLLVALPAEKQVDCPLLLDREL
jgi:hypothetical protein